MLTKRCKCQHRFFWKKLMLTHQILTSVLKKTDVNELTLASVFKKQMLTSLCYHRFSSKLMSTHAHYLQFCHHVHVNIDFTKNRC